MVGKLKSFQQIVIKKNWLKVIQLCHRDKSKPKSFKKHL